MAIQKNNTNNSDIFWFSILLCFLVLILPYLFASFKYLFLSESYYHARMANQFLKDGFSDFDPLSYGGRNYFFEPYHLVLVFFSYLIPVEIVSHLLPLVCGIFSLIFFYFIINHLFQDLRMHILTLIIFISSPIFIYSFTTSTPMCVSVFFLLLGFYLFIKQKNIFYIISIISFSIACIFDLLNLPVIVLLLSSYYHINPKLEKKIYYTLLFVLLFSLPYHIYFFYLKGLPKIAKFAFPNLLSHYISELGSHLGFSTFVLLMFILGVALTWDHKSKLYLVYFLMIELAILCYYLDYAMVCLNLIVSVFAGYGFFRLIHRKWELDLIKNLTILAIVCGLIFSSMSYLTRIKEIQPAKESVEALTWLSNYTKAENPEYVLSHFSNGFYIEYFAGQKAYIDEKFLYAPDLYERYNFSVYIFSENNIIKARKSLKERNITYIFVDKRMKEGLVWNDERKGLIYLFRNQETFDKIYSKDGVEIYKVRK